MKLKLLALLSFALPLAVLGQKDSVNKKLQKDPTLKPITSDTTYYVDSINAYYINSVVSELLAFRQAGYGKLPPALYDAIEPLIPYLRDFMVSRRVKQTIVPKKKSIP